MLLPSACVMFVVGDFHRWAIRNTPIATDLRRSGLSNEGGGNAQFWGIGEEIVAF